MSDFSKAPWKLSSSQVGLSSLDRDLTLNNSLLESQWSNIVGNIQFNFIASLQ